MSFAERPPEEELIEDQMHQRRNHALAYLAIAGATAVTFVAHEIHNHWKPDLLAGTGAVLIGGTAGLANGNYKKYKELKHQLENEE